MIEHSSQPESDLVQEVLGGDPDALDRWFRAEHPRVWRLALGFLARADVAEDLAQDAMLKLHDKLEHWNPERPYAQWRNTIVLNMCRDRLRSEATRTRLESAAAEVKCTQPLPDPSKVAEQGELRDLLRKALGQLTDREREAFVLRELEGGRMNDVAAVMGIERASLRSLLTLARQRMRNYLGTRCPEYTSPKPGGGEHV